MLALTWTVAILAEQLIDNACQAIYSCQLLVKKLCTGTVLNGLFVTFIISLTLQPRNMLFRCRIVFQFAEIKQVLAKRYST